VYKARQICVDAALAVVQCISHYSERLCCFMRTSLYARVACDFDATLNDSLCYTTTGDTAIKAAAELYTNLSRKVAAISEPCPISEVTYDEQGRQIFTRLFPYDFVEITPEHLTLDEARAAATLFVVGSAFHTVKLTHDGVPEKERAQYLQKDGIKYKCEHCAQLSGDVAY
jgi:hypothetical protein